MITSGKMKLRLKPTTNNRMYITTQLLIVPFYALISKSRNIDFFVPIFSKVDTSRFIFFVAY